ncbi:hypothetical protein C900_00300 [Fulvivirga imtechensis AK7]|uniref:histidine kinase n=1 Tax=Fulvivirga imtechensis AK7 TaxID=1237149 RepID=L8JHX1_9BACT|nr:ATP-binding protein [Fulvivirga imtechensis]ELR68466.1 hypothetical protein C900_00300 [Fulvivirga imtechensis AK7]
MASFKIILGVLFGILVSAIVILGFISYRTNQAVSDTADMIENTNAVLYIAENISSLSKSLQLESNGIFVNMDPEFIQPYKTARNQLLLELEKLRDLIEYDTDQRHRLDSLENMLEDLVVFSDSALAFYSEYEQDPDAEARVSMPILERVKRTNYFRSNIRAVLNAIKAEEKQQLSIRQTANDRSIEAFDRTFKELLFGMLILLVATFFIVRYQFNKRIKAQQELKMANELFTRLFHESPIGLVICDLDTGRINDCNKAYASLINYNRRDVLGKTALELNIIQDESHRTAIVEAVVENEVMRDVEMKIIPKDKEPIWVSVSSQLTNVRGKQCLLSATLDMTSHKRAEEGIKKALAAEVELNKMKSNFVSMASHEFRTPLTTILSSVFLLENYLSDERQEKVTKHLARVKSSVNMLTSILDDFLSVTKIEEGKVKAKIEKLNLKEYLEDLCRNMKNFAKSGQNIIYDHKGMIDAYIDPLLLGSIVNNLLSNAIKYSPENSDIYVSSVLNAYMHLAIKDSGIGIPEEDKQHLFDRFFRASNAGNVQGTGLGLHITKHYVDMLKGKIEVNSELGRGSEVNLTFQNAAPDT